MAIDDIPGSDPDALPDGAQTDTTQPSEGEDTVSGGGADQPQKG